ncbi:hypothetical protein [Chromobacterium haemolyticum]
MISKTSVLAIMDHLNKYLNHIRINTKNKRRWHGGEIHLAR